MGFYLEYLQDVSRKRKSRNWLEPKNGVGSAAARTSAGSVANWCIMCGTDLAVCLGPSCMGKKAISEMIVSETLGLSSGRVSLPGYCSDRTSAANHASLKSRDFTDIPKKKISAYRFPCSFSDNKAAIKVRTLAVMSQFINSLPAEVCWR